MTTQAVQTADAVTDSEGRDLWQALDLGANTDNREALFVDPESRAVERAGPRLLGDNPEVLREAAQGGRLVEEVDGLKVAVVPIYYGGDQRGGVVLATSGTADGCGCGWTGARSRLRTRGGHKRGGTPTRLRAPLPGGEWLGRGVRAGAGDLQGARRKDGRYNLHRVRRGDQDYREDGVAGGRSGGAEKQRADGVAVRTSTEVISDGTVTPAEGATPARRPRGDGEGR